jgi:glycerol-3-phosphate dehydrogenase
MERRFLLPTYSAWEKPFYGIGLKVYDYLAGRTTMAGTKVIGAAAATELVPTLNATGLKGGVLYSDGQFDDSRLAVSLLRTAHGLGAAAVNGAPVTSLIRAGRRITGATVRDEETGQELTIRAKCVVNATGVFSDAVRRMDDPAAAPIVAASQGIHLVLDRSFLPGETAILVPRTSDGRVIFIIPWMDRTLLGTTDTPVEGPSVEPVALRSEVDFVLEHAGRYLTRQPARADVLSAFAGLRPLVKSSDRVTSALSRDHTLLVSPAGLVTITGGKWTTYRRMAEDTVNRAARVGGLPEQPCTTGSLRLHGAGGADNAWRAFGASAAEVASYEARYQGSLHPNLPYTFAMAAFVIDTEMPRHLEDVLSRRLRALYLDARAAVVAAPRVAELMAQLTGQSEEWARTEVGAFRCLAQKHLLEGD